MLIRCPMCGWEKRVKDELEGRDGQCRYCGEQFTLTAVAELPKVAPIVVDATPPIVVKSEAITTFSEEKPRSKKIALIAIGAAVLLATHAGALLVGSAAGSSKVTSLTRELEASRQEVRDLGMKVAAGRPVIPITRKQLGDALTKDFAEFRVTEETIVHENGRSSVRFQIGNHRVIASGFGDAIDEVIALIGITSGDVKVPARISLSLTAAISPEWPMDERSNWIIAAREAAVEHGVIVSEVVAAVRWSIGVFVEEGGQVISIICHPAPHS